MIIDTAFIQPLVGPTLTLSPLREADVEALAATVADGDLWESTTTVIPHPDAMGAYVARALRDVQRGRAVPYVIRLAADNRAVGSIRCWKIEHKHRKLEIGHVWVARSFQRRRVHTEANYLLLREVFDVAGMLRVQYLADEANEASRRAIAMLGASEEGILRNERVMPDGRARNTVVMSIVAHEWPQRRLALEQTLNLRDEQTDR
nr:GNAT family protein [Burkholderia ambifaria]